MCGCFAGGTVLRLHQICALLLVFVCLPARAAEPISVEQLKAMLAVPLPKGEDGPIANLQDARLATQIDGVDLSERLTDATLKKIEDQQAFRAKTKEALRLLAFRSALFDPPQNEFLDRAALDSSQQKELLEGAHAFAFQTLRRLPNFFATRTTYRFFGIPAQMNESGLPMFVGLHARGNYSREITYRDGQEVLDPMRSDSSESVVAHSNVARWSQSGLETWGEFGPELAVVLMDADGGSIAFHHWEQDARGSVAVFRFSVPEEASHYEVSYACNFDQSFHAQPAYHGTLSIDPATGAVMRILLQADWKPGDPISHVASVIEYGPVEIGGRTYVCPLTSLAFSVQEVNGCSVDTKHARIVHPMLLNRTEFNDYHRLGSTARIIPDPKQASTPSGRPQN